MSQPLRGIVTTGVAMALALGFVSLVPLPAFLGSVSLYLLCLIPMQVMTCVIWGADPPFVRRLRQPAKGVALLALNLAVGAVVFPVLLALVGEGVRPPGPVPSQFAVIAVPTTFYLCVIFGGWPFTRLLPSPVAAGIATLVAAYVLNALVFQVFFDYTFLDGTPVSLASAPRGLFMAVQALVFYVTVLAGMFVVIHFDLWPLTAVPALRAQPLLGVAWLLVALALAGAAVAVGVPWFGDPMVFFTRVTVPFIFGTIVIQNMLQNSVFGAMKQPLKGVANVAAAALVGVALAAVYGALGPAVAGPLASGPPSYDYELWLANALLSVTFPLLIVLAAYFEFWPVGDR